MSYHLDSLSQLLMTLLQRCVSYSDNLSPRVSYLTSDTKSDPANYRPMCLPVL